MSAWSVSARYSGLKNVYSRTLDRGWTKRVDFGSAMDLVFCEAFATSIFEISVRIWNWALLFVPVFNGRRSRPASIPHRTSRRSLSMVHRHGWNFLLDRKET